MQDASPDRDVEFATNVNGRLQDPDYDLQWNVPITSTTAPQASTSTAAAVPQASSSTAGSGSNFQATPEQIAALESALASMAGAQVAPAEASLTDILTPSNLIPLFNNHSELIPTLFPHLPPDLPVPPSAEVLQRIIHSPQFRAAVANFDQALRTGLLGGLVRGLGLPAEAGLGIGPFLRAVQEQANRAEGAMETD